MEERIIEHDAAEQEAENPAFPELGVVMKLVESSFHQKIGSLVCRYSGRWQMRSCSSLLSLQFTILKRAVKVLYHEGNHVDDSDGRVVV